MGGSRWQLARALDSKRKRAASDSMDLEHELASIHMDGLFLTQGSYQWREGESLRENEFPATQPSESVAALAAARLGAEAAPRANVAEDSSGGTERSRSRSPRVGQRREGDGGGAPSAAAAGGSSANSASVPSHPWRWNERREEPTPLSSAVPACGEAAPP